MQVTRLAVLLLTIAIIVLLLVGVVIMLRRREIEKVSQYESILEEVKNELFNEQDYRLFCYYVAGFSTKTISIIVR